MIGRLTDRFRPWAAPIPSPGVGRVAVIGAGPAGLATAALLRRAGVDAIVFDRRHQVGGSWATRYDSLRLNTVRWMSDLPGLRMPRQMGRWVGRDDVVEYLRTYAEHHRLDTRLGTDVTAITHSADRWTLTTSEGAELVDGVVIATGHSQRSVMPTWPGIERFTGRLIHAADYRAPSDHKGASVLVVGAGSSGGEICADLARAGVDVTWSVRTAPQVFPREVLGMPATPFAPPADLLPDRLLDRVAPWVERRIYGPRDYLPEPTEPMMRLFERCKEPMTADGIVGLIRDGDVSVVAAVDDLDERGAILVDGTRADADHIVAATGYRTGLEPLVGHLGVLDEHGRPAATTFPDALAFVGFRIPFTGTLWGIERDARTVARSVAATVLSRVRPQGLEP